ncbi:MAG: prephenate dehydrogenase [Lachnospiraceae bacterium]|nr:prephenate dehydrogenase [Lachnospiraceae bacterium]
MNSDAVFLIVGLGLMGGSYAKALKAKEFTVYAIDRDEDSIKFALENGIIDKGAVNNDPELISEADYIVIALYPTLVVNWVKDNQECFRPGTILTDVTGIKFSVVYSLQDILRSDVEFIAAHPMAGRELSGVRNSDPNIFTKANYIVVPTDRNTSETIAWCKELGSILGFSRISELSPEDHDRAIAFVSQLTHCIAVSLMTCTDNEHLADYTGDSFRDLTRIARINENMWTELFFLNKEALLREMDLFIGEFNSIRNLIESENGPELKEKMRLSTKRRALFDKK